MAVPLLNKRFQLKTPFIAVSSDVIKGVFVYTRGCSAELGVVLRASSG